MMHQGVTFVVNSIQWLNISMEYGQFLLASCQGILENLILVTFELWQSLAKTLSMYDEKYVILNSRKKNRRLYGPSIVCK